MTFSCISKKRLFLLLFFFPWLELGWQPQTDTKKTSSVRQVCLFLLFWRKVLCCSRSVRVGRPRSSQENATEPTNDSDTQQVNTN